MLEIAIYILWRVYNVQCNFTVVITNLTEADFLCVTPPKKWMKIFYARAHILLFVATSGPESKRCSQIHSHWLGDIVDSGIGLPYRPELILSPKSGCEFGYYCFRWKSDHLADFYFSLIDNLYSEMKLSKIVSNVLFVFVVPCLRTRPPPPSMRIM